MSDINKKNLMVFLGLKNCGKNYNAQPYLEMGFKNISFADPLREMVWSILDYTPNKVLNYDDFKKSEAILRKPNKFLNLFAKKVVITTGRKILQNAGSVIKSMFGETIWADLWAKSVLESEQNVVCTDCRFTYEVFKALSLSRKGYNVSFIWVCYEKANFNEILKDKHESEALSQYIYYNQEKYGLYDLCEIKPKVLKQIISDFEQQQTEETLMHSCVAR